MIKKLAVYIIFLSALNGCAPVLSMLGPVFSYTQSGNIMHSALSYGSNVAFKKMKDKSSTENNKKAFDD
tara:strand:+ start:191 stop:397 length:207 start_codon:yes stop_codon:yes gene_type:complete